MRREERRVARRQAPPEAESLWQMIRQLPCRLAQALQAPRASQSRQRVVDDTALDFRGHAAGLLVDGHDSPRVNRLALDIVSRFPQDLVLRVHELQAAAAAHLDLAKADDVDPHDEDVLEKRLVEPDRAQRAARIRDQYFENLEPGAARRPYAAADDAAGDRRCLARFEGRDRLQVAAVFVANGKTVQEIFEREEAGARQVGGATRTDALQKLERRRENVFAIGIHSRLALWKLYYGSGGCPTA